MPRKSDTRQTINKFLDKTHARTREGMRRGEEYWLFVVQDLDKHNPDEPTISLSATFKSPFLGKSPKECYDMLREHVAQYGSELCWTSPVILDEESTMSSSALIVQESSEQPDGLDSIRAEFPLVEMTALCYGAKPPMDEDKEEAATTGGILRTPPTSPPEEEPSEEDRPRYPGKLLMRGEKRREPGLEDVEHDIT